MLNLTEYPVQNILYGPRMNCISVVKERCWGLCVAGTVRGWKELSLLTPNLALVDNTALSPPGSAAQFSTELFSKGFAH